MAQEGYLKCDLAFAMGDTSSFPDLQDDVYKYREFANIIPRRRLSLAAANLFSKLASPTAWAAVRNWKKEKEKKRKKRELKIQGKKKISEWQIFIYQELTFQLHSI